MAFNTALVQHLGDMARHLPLVPKVAANYFRLLVLRKPVLRAVDFAITFKCQCACEHCYTAQMDDPSRELLSSDEAKEAIDQCLALGALAINFAGGEPLLREDIVELVAHVPAHRAATVITTNGILLTRALLSELKAAGLGFLAVSLDHDSAEAHDRFRRQPGTFDSAVKGIEEARSHGIIVVINTMATEGKLQDGTCRRMVEMARRYRARINLSIPSAVGSYACQGQHRLSPEAASELARLMKLPHVRWDGSSNYLREGCGAAREKISITAYGDVLPCGLIMASFGNLRRESLAEIWRRMMAVPEFQCLGGECPTAYDQAFIEKYLRPINRYAQQPAPAEEIFPVNGPPAPSGDADTEVTENEVTDPCHAPG